MKRTKPAIWTCVETKDSYEFCEICQRGTWHTVSRWSVNTTPNVIGIRTECHGCNGEDTLEEKEYNKEDEIEKEENRWRRKLEE